MTARKRAVFLFAHHALNLRCHLSRLIELLLADLTSVQHLLYLLARVDLHSALEILEPGHEVAHVTHVHIAVQRLIE